MIRTLTDRQVGQRVRDDGPKSHLPKAGTPTMGGALILVAIGVSTLLWSDLANRFVWITLGVTLAFGLIGFWDDYLKLVVGQLPRPDCTLQVLLAVGRRPRLRRGAVRHGQDAGRNDAATCRSSRTSCCRSVLGYIVVAYLVVVGASNAVNLTDGLDGLAIMPAVMVGGALGVFAYVTGNVVFSGLSRHSLRRRRRRAAGVLRGAGGRGLGFLWFNTYPAQVFMGDIGALALGAALGVVAVIVRQEIVLFIMGGVFVMETVSVMLQVASFKLTGKRIFRMAPIHHHFELKGWAEPKVIVRFWIITVVLVLVGLATLKVR